MACNNDDSDCGPFSSSAASSVSTKQKSYPINQACGLTDQAASPAGSFSGLGHCHSAGHVDSPNFPENGHIG